MKFLIIGVNGQDGSYLVENISKLYPNSEIYGLSYHESLREELKNLNVQYFKADLTEKKNFLHYLDLIQPNYIYYTAAHTGSSESNFENNLYKNLSLNYLNVAYLLDYLKVSDFGQLIYFSSGRVFSNHQDINENSSKHADDLYSFFKIQAEELINYYRNNFNVCSNVFWLFNHESPRRPDDYFSSKILKLLHNLKNNLKNDISIRNIDFYNNWGHAREYMQIILKLSLDFPNDDFIIANSEQLYARDIFEDIFKENGFEINDYVLNSYNKDKANKVSISINKMQSHICDLPKLAGKNLFKSIYFEKYNEKI